MFDSPSIGPEEFAELERLALVGELTGTLVHDCNNFLNVVLLQVALLEMGGSADIRSQLAGLRGEADEFKAMLDQLQPYRRSTPAPPYSVDINAAVGGVVNSVYSETPELFRLELSPGVLEVAGTASGMRRLILLLLADQTRLAAGRTVVVRTQAGDVVRLSFERSPGPASSTAADSGKGAASLESADLPNHGPPASLENPRTDSAGRRGDPDY